MDVQMVEVKDQIITIKTKWIGVDSDIWISFVYANCNRKIREELWEGIKTLAEGNVGRGRWAVMGDFNCILNPEEKKGGLEYDMRKSKEFQQCINETELRDVAFYGNTFTWWNGRNGEQAIWKRLDRCLVNECWENEFSTYVQHLSKSTSDHSPLLIKLEPHKQFGRKPFTFLNVWCDHEQFQEVVRRTWEEKVQGNAMYTFMIKLKRLRAVLKKWNWEVFGDIFAKIKKLEGRVMEVEGEMQDCYTEENVIKYRRAQAKLQKQIVVEEKFWQQKSHSNWVVEGERNTKYFHGIVRERRKKQYIHKIKNEEGLWEEEQERIAELAVEYFQELYTEGEVETNLEAYDCLQGLVTEEDNEMLTKMPTMQEAIPSHMFYAIGPPKTVIKKIEKLLADFFWGTIDGKAKYHWSSWSNLAKPIKEGGVGLTSLSEVIEAVGMKLWWHFRAHKSLWGDFLRAKYCKRAHPVCKSWQYGDSQVWRRMLDCREKADQ
ncbi:uncharacterized protein LOC116018726 isoform X2 [Ipomoea triloba]|uniref:uncharacterized protein LOC116018726 isoform X2 n=1 Tax=Ipomoea triloba TaxID=35885 RepID=UPI00125E4CF1|nr:uncharacterized protein LOC116018726 isoform X2 [Ipomoea triloba]